MLLQIFFNIYSICSRQPFPPTQDASISTSQASPDANMDDPPALPSPSKKPRLPGASKRKSTSSSSHNNHRAVVEEEEESMDDGGSAADDFILPSPRGIVMTAAAAKAVAASSLGSPMITLSPVKVKCNCEEKHRKKLEECRAEAEREKEEAVKDAVAEAVRKTEMEAAKKVIVNLFNSGSAEFENAFGFWKISIFDIFRNKFHA